jgi:hypothetical protein
MAIEAVEYGDEGPQAVEDIVCRVIGALASNPVQRAAPSDVLISGLGFGSMRLAELAFALQEVFDLRPIRIKNTMMDETAADMGRYVLNELTEGRGSFPGQTTLAEILKALSG